MTDDLKPRYDPLDELKNFQEIASYLNPSPGEIPSLAGAEICGLSMPMLDVIGGDHIIYIDFNRRYDLDRRIARAEEAGQDAVAVNLRDLRRRAGILVADVSGHRMTDALIGAMLHQAFLLGVNYELDMFGEITTRLFEQINTRFYRSTAINKYFTMIYGEISDNGGFRFLSAGHQPPAIFSREFRQFMPVSSDRMIAFQPVGTLPSQSDPDDGVNPSIMGHAKQYEINQIKLMAIGDVLLLYTDGLSEHADGNYFPEGLETLMAKVVDRPAAEICDCLREDLLEWGQPKDDISVVVIRKTGPPLGNS